MKTKGRLLLLGILFSCLFYLAHCNSEGSGGSCSGSNLVNEQENDTGLEGSPIDIPLPVAKGQDDQGLDATSIRFSPGSSVQNLHQLPKVNGYPYKLAQLASPTLGTLSGELIDTSVEKTILVFHNGKLISDITTSNGQFSVPIESGYADKTLAFSVLLSNESVTPPLVVNFHSAKAPFDQPSISILITNTGPEASDQNQAYDFGEQRPLVNYQTGDVFLVSDDSTEHSIARVSHNGGSIYRDIDGISNPATLKSTSSGATFRAFWVDQVTGLYAYQDSNADNKITETDTGLDFPTNRQFTADAIGLTAISTFNPSSDRIGLLIDHLDSGERIFQGGSFDATELKIHWIDATKLLVAQINTNQTTVSIYELKNCLRNLDLSGPDCDLSHKLFERTYSSSVSDFSSSGGSTSKFWFICDGGLCGEDWQNPSESELPIAIQTSAFEIVSIQAYAGRYVIFEGIRNSDETSFIGIYYPQSEDIEFLVSKGKKPAFVSTSKIAYVSEDTNGNYQLGIHTFIEDDDSSAIGFSFDNSQQTLSRNQIISPSLKGGEPPYNCQSNATNVATTHRSSGVVSPITTGSFQLTCTDISGQTATQSYSVVSSASFDSSFGNSGILSITKSSMTERMRHIVVLDDNSLIIAGELPNDNDRDFAAMKITSSGTIDSQFGSNGLWVYDFGGEEFVNAVSLSSDSLLLAGQGSSGGGGTNYALVASLTFDGELNSQFTSGYLLEDVYTSAQITGAVYQNNSWYLVGEDSSDTLFIKIDTAGNLDSQFGEFEGYTEKSLSIINPTGLSFSEQAQTWIVTGDNANYGGYAFFDNSGSLISSAVEFDSFSNSSIQGSINIGENHIIFGHSDGDFFAVQIENQSVNQDFTFTKNLGSSSENILAAVQNNESKIGMIGFSGAEAALIQLGSDGSLDTGFNSNGYLLIDEGYSSHTGFDIAVDNYGRYVIVIDTPSATLVMRLYP